MAWRAASWIAHVSTDCHHTNLTSNKTEPRLWCCFNLVFSGPLPPPPPPPPDTAATFKIKDGWDANTYGNETIFQYAAGSVSVFDKGTHTIVMHPKSAAEQGGLFGGFLGALGELLPAESTLTDCGVGFKGTLAGPDGYNIEVSIACPVDPLYQASWNYSPSDASTFKLGKTGEVSRPVVRSCSNTTSTSLTCHAASAQLGHSTPAINITTIALTLC